MNDPESFDGPDSHLNERMERAVGGLRAPDVVPRAMARGRRQRTHRRLAFAGGGIAAVTALALTVPAFAGHWVGQDQKPSGPPVAADPAASSSPSTGVATGSEDNPCVDETPPGWWDKSADQLRAELSALLPEGTRIGTTNDSAGRNWGGNLVTGDDADFAAVHLLPPPNPSPKSSREQRAEELATGVHCVGPTTEPMQAIKPCDELTGHVACEEIRSEDGKLVGVVTEKVQTDIVDGQEQPTDMNYVSATVAGPEGGHVEFWVGEGTRADRPHTVHDPADVPALTVSQVKEIVTNSFWTS